MDADDRAGLIQFLFNQKPSKKRDISQVSPADEGRQPLVEMRRSSFNSRAIKETPLAAEIQQGRILLEHYLSFLPSKSINTGSTRAKVKP